MPSVSHTFTTRSARETERAGERLAGLLAPDDVIALTGDLGAGKTCLVQGVARGLGIDEPVTSPTFNLLLVHPGRLPLCHIDLYRLERAEELDDVGFYEALESGSACLIEWGDRFPETLPADHVSVIINRGAGDTRTFEVRGGGPRSDELAVAWAAACSEEGLAP